MAFSNSTSVTPRVELPYAIMQGAGLNDQLIWNILAPPLGLDQRTAHLPQFTIAGAELLRIVDRITAPGADAPRMTAGISDFLFTLGIRRIEIGIPDENEMDWSRLFDLINLYGRLLGKDMLALSLEYLVAQALFSTANFGSPPLRAWLTRTPTARRIPSLRTSWASSKPCAMPGKPPIPS